MKNDLYQIFEKEFNCQMELFSVCEYSLSDLLGFNDIQDICVAGVYVFVQNDRILKIGKNNLNVKKRSLEHIQDNTAGIMGDLKNQKNISVVYFTLLNNDKLHWIYALEVYLERYFRKKDNLKIWSGRI